MTKISDKVYHLIGFGSLLLTGVLYYVLTLNIKDASYDRFSSAPNILYLLIGFMSLMTLIGFSSFMVSHQLKTKSRKLLYVQLFGLTLTLIGLISYCLAVVNLNVTFLEPPLDASQEILGSYYIKLIDHNIKSNNQRLFGQFFSVVGIHVFGLGSLVVMAELKEKR